MFLGEVGSQELGCRHRPGAAQGILKTPHTEGDSPNSLLRISADGLEPRRWNFVGLSPQRMRLSRGRHPGPASGASLVEQLGQTDPGQPPSGPRTRREACPLTWSFKSASEGQGFRVPENSLHYENQTHNQTKGKKNSYL